MRKYIEQERGPDGLYLPEPRNDGEVIFDRTLDADDSPFSGPMRRLGYRYWDCWTKENRSHPLVLRVVEELGDKASGDHAKLRIVEIPDGTDFTIEEYDGIEHVAEAHRTWA